MFCFRTKSWHVTVISETQQVSTEDLRIQKQFVNPVIGGGYHSEVVLGCKIMFFTNILAFVSICERKFSFQRQVVTPVISGGFYSVEL